MAEEFIAYAKEELTLYEKKREELKKRKTILKGMIKNCEY